MYKIPRSYNINVIANNKIIQIAFGLNFITLFFDKGFIQFSGGFSLQFNEKEFNFEEVYPVKNDFGLLNIFLEKEVLFVRTNEKRDLLILEFEENITLVLNSSEDYESFILNFNGNVIRV